MADLAELLVRIDATTEQLRRELRRGESAVADSERRINRELAKIDSSFAGIAASARNFLGIFGVGLGVGGLAMMARDALDAAGGLGEMAEQLGITTDMLQVMQFAASQAGVKAQELEAGFMKFASVVGEAAQGEKTAIEAFDRLGVKILDQNGKLRANEAVLGDVSDALARTGDGALRAAAAKDLFGRSGQRLLPILSGGRERLAEFAAEARAAGMVLSGEMIGAADQAADKIAALELKIGKLFQTVVAGMAGPASAFIDWLQGAGASRLDFEIALAENSLRNLEARAEDIRKGGEPGILSQLFFGSKGLEELDAEIEAARQKLEQLREIQRETGRRFPQATEPSAPGARNPSKKDDERATRDLTSALDEYVARLHDEVFVLRQSKDMREIERAVMEAQNAAMKEGNLLTQEQIDLVRSLAEEKQRITEQDKAAEEARRKAEKEAADLLRENERAARDFANVIGTAFEDAVLEGEKLSDVLKALEKDIARIILRMTVTKNLEKGIGGIVDIAGDWLGRTIGPLFGFDPSGTFGGVGNGPAARASGGPVTASTPFLVGERGPELFVPHTSGTIVSNDNLSRMGGGPVFNIDARGASVEAVVRLERMVRALNGSIESRAVAAVTDSRRRGQALA